ncbi:hypothetical protein EXIGLDRAFT_708969 [Exidia glandulosa HHB12029]|uniref:F-box domain-containing protein n=1 Tax=Exidia glandulosa HHB12029 TaxID=1314781 RepID=A0A165J3Z4_EXIGL|nr:hypothetical protein EXIGLDRAFT_708969 [Exidia glandulosa HHB12029]
MSFFVHDISELGGELYPTLPFIVASVCRTWRDIALDTPSLWTLCLSIDRGLRSRHLPLVVYVQILDDITVTAFAGLDDIMPKVLARVGDLTIFQRSDHSANDDTPDHCDVDIDHELLLPSTPELRDVMVRRLSPTRLSRSAFATVRELRVRARIGLDHVLALSRIAPDLELLNLDGIDDDDFEYDTPNATTRFASLHTLVLHDVHELRAFPTNAFPSLDVLDIRVTSQDGPAANCIPFMPLLRTLRVHCSDRSGNTHTKVAALISRVRHIERLEIWTRRDTGRLWDCLLEPDETLVPGLRHLIVNVRGYHGFQHTDEGDRIANFLETREARRQVAYGRVPNRIHTVELYGTRMPTPFIARIRRNPVVDRRQWTAMDETDPTPLHDFVSNRTFPHARVLDNPPYRVKEDVVANSGRPDLPRFEEAYDGVMKKFTKLLIGIAALLTVTIFTPVNDNLLNQMPHVIRPASRTYPSTQSASGTSRWTISDRDNPLDDPDDDSDAECDLNDQLVRSGATGRQVHAVTLRDTISLAELYDAQEIYGEYNAQNLLARISSRRPEHVVVAACRSVMKRPAPTFQKRMLEDMPTEIVMMVTEYLPREDQINLSSTSRAMRDMCTATFTMRVTIGRLAERRTRGVPDSTSILCTTSEACCQLVQSLNDFMSNTVYVANVRNVVIINQWIDIYPGFHDFNPPSALNASMFDPVFNAVCSLLASIRVVSIRMRGLGITYQMMDHIRQSATLKSLHLDRCVPVFARLGGIDAEFDRLRATRVPSYTALSHTHLDATMCTITRLTIGFGLEVYAHSLNWNVVRLCSGLRSLYCYSSDSSGGFAFPSRGLDSLLHLAALEDLIFENCTPALGRLIDCSASRQHNADDSTIPGAWRRLKLRTSLPIRASDFQRLVAYIGQYQQDLGVLVVEGLRYVPPSAVEALAVACPKLRAVGITKRKRETSMNNNCCTWDAPIQAYTGAFGRFLYLEHLTTNFLWIVEEAPAINDHQHADPDDVYTLTDEHPVQDTYDYRATDARLYRVGTDVDTHVSWSPINIAYNFHVATPSLRSLAVKSEFYECRVEIYTDVDLDTHFTLVDNPEDDPVHHEWNPPIGVPW